MVGQRSGRLEQAVSRNMFTDPHTVGTEEGLTLHDGDCLRARPCCPAVQQLLTRRQGPERRETLIFEAYNLSVIVEHMWSHL